MNKKVSKNIEHRAKQHLAREQQKNLNDGRHLSSELPELRQIIETTDLDYGTPIKHRMELYRTNRIDCYDVFCR